MSTSISQRKQNIKQMKEKLNSLRYSDGANYNCWSLVQIVDTLLQDYQETLNDLEEVINND